MIMTVVVNYGKPTKKIEKCFSRKGFCCFAGAREANSLNCGKKMDRHQMVYAALNSTSKPNVCHVCHGHKRAKMVDGHPSHNQCQS